MKPIEAREGRVLLRVRVQPRASRDAIRLESDGRIRVTLMAPPVEGAANKALTAFIAKRLGIAKRQVTLVQGGHSREKTLSVEGVGAEEVAAILEDTKSGPRTERNQL
ncbi:MAG: hypothetical protein GWP08_12490 [Nitrospiraceae bacterium]|nr:hypothetical protein [Nitrospiraceae bacterium]